MTRAEYAAYVATVNERLAWSLNVHDVPPHISATPCECCQRPLGGLRYLADTWDGHSDDGYVELSVCADCVYYADNGQLDDATMAALTDE